MRWPKRGSNKKSGTSGLVIDATGIAAASIEHGRELSMHALPVASAGEAGTKNLGTQIAALSLDRSQLTLVLPTGSYQMLLVQRPAVPAAEARAAIRWQIKDLLDFPVDEAIVELFDIPEQSNQGNSAMAYAVAAKRSTVQRQINTMHDAGLRLTAIDIPELCVRNVAACLPQDADGVALLSFSEDHGMLTVTRQGLLYFIRHIDRGAHALRRVTDDALASADTLSPVVLEVQRSLDYYESHYSRRPVTELVIAPGADIDELPALLRQQLGLTVSRLDFSEHFKLKTGMPAGHHHGCLLAIGAALRNELLAA